jgi:hypothetical protein
VDRRIKETYPEVRHVFLDPTAATSRPRSASGTPGA